LDNSQAKILNLWCGWGLTKTRCPREIEDPDDDVTSGTTERDDEDEGEPEQDKHEQQHDHRGQRGESDDQGDQHHGELQVPERLCGADRSLKLVLGVGRLGGRARSVGAMINKMNPTSDHDAMSLDIDHLVRAGYDKLIGAEELLGIPNCPPPVAAAAYVALGDAALAFTQAVLGGRSVVSRSPQDLLAEAVQVVRTKNSEVPFDELVRIVRDRNASVSVGAPTTTNVAEITDAVAVVAAFGRASEAVLAWERARLKPDLPDFVEQSNAIEGYLTSVFGRSSGHPIFVRHLAVAERIEAGENLGPKGIHKALLEGLLAPGLVAGSFRNGPSAVGQVAMPDDREIEARMRAWDADAAAGPDGDAGAWAWAMHHEFVCHHPFPDGNGRVARLLLNQHRLAAGLPWLTVRAEDADDYAEAIRAWHARHQGADRGWG
jgi:hypothetical protein